MNPNTNIDNKEWKILLNESIKIDTIMESLKESLLTTNQLDRFKKCANMFIHKINESRKIKRVYFCKMKICPHCKRKQEIEHQSSLIRCIEQSKVNNKNMRLMVIKTFIKIQDNNLTNDIKTLNLSFNKIFRSFRRKMPIKIKDFIDNCYLGYHKTLEITYNKKDKQYYIVLRCILAIKENYFKNQGRYYVSGNIWKKHFQNILKDNELLDFKVKYINKDDTTYDFLKEYVKNSYDLEPILQTKDEKEGLNILKTYTNALYQQHKFISTGGIFSINFNKL